MKICEKKNEVQHGPFYQEGDGYASFPCPQEECDLCGMCFENPQDI